MKKIALVTGGNRGIGFETCRQLGKQHYQVLLAGRNIIDGQEKAKQLQSEGLDVIFYPLDVTKKESMQAIHATVKKEWNRLDVLINNAGILLDDKNGKDDLLQVDLELLRKTMQTNVEAPFFLSQLFLPLMLKNHYGRIVNVSSEMGQLSSMGHVYPTYSISKASLNAVTRVFSSRSSGTNVLVNSVCPGWVRTEMGGPMAPRSLDKGTEGIIWAATLPDGGPTGGFFRDGKPLDW